MKRLAFFTMIVFLLINPCLISAAEKTAGNLSGTGEAVLEKGIAEYKSENFEEAVEYLLEARKKLPGSSVAAFYLGLSYKQTGIYRQALSNFKDALSLTPPVTDAYTELIDVLYNLNEFKEAKEWIAKAEKEGIKPAYISFLKGMVFAKEDNNKGAIEAFKKAKELDSSLAQSVDFQIAMTYAKDRKIAEAKESLKAVISIDPTSELASFAKEYENALTRTLAAYKTWRFTIGAGYQFDTNVISKPTSFIGISSVDVASGKKDSSMFNSLRIDYAPMTSGDFSFNAQYNAYTNNYFHSPAFKYDTFLQSISLIPGYNLKGGSITLPLNYSHVWLTEHEYMHMTTLKPTLSVMLFPDLIGQLSLGYGKREMINAALDPDEDRDANVYNASVGYVYPFMDGKAMVNFKYEYSIEETDGRNWANNGNRMNLGLLLPLRDKINMVMSGDILVQKYNNYSTIFNAPGYPDNPTERFDKVYSGSAGFIWELFKNLNLNLQYSFTRSDSNFAIYDYKRSVYASGLEYSF